MTDQPHGGLVVPSGLDDIGEQEGGVIHQRWSFFKESLAYAQNEIGIPPPIEPEYACPTLTAEDLTNPDSNEYSTKFLRFQGWYNYVTEKLSMHKAVQLELIAEMDDLESRLRESYRKNSSKTSRSGEKKPPGAADMADRINGHPRYVELKQRRLQTAQIITILSAKEETLGTALKLLSRQVEIRRQNFDGNNRSGNISGRGGVPNAGMRTPGHGFAR